MTLTEIYANHCRTPFPTPTEDEVEAFEQRYELTLPAEYRQYLVTCNGGGFRGVVISFGDQRSDFLTYMHGLKATFSGAELGEDINLFDDNEPPIILPIGGCGFGSLILLVVDGGEDNGHVFFKHPGDGPFQWLASSLTDFFDSLSFDDE